MESASVKETPGGPPRARAFCGGLPADDALRAPRADELDEALDDIIGSWPTTGLSDHLALEIAAVHRSGRPLERGARVPGCVCPLCTGIPNEVPAWTLRTPAYARKIERWASWDARVDQARGVPLLEVVRFLGLGDPVKRGKELAVRCPLHEDRHPSLRLNPGKGMWFCHPCGEGGDGLRLFMQVRRVDFAEAVRELAA